MFGSVRAWAVYACLARHGRSAPGSRPAHLHRKDNITSIFQVSKQFCSWALSNNPLPPSRSS